jgi:Holliday junction resolvase RusA-like endonuclease
VFELVVRGRPAPQGSKRAIPQFKGKGAGREWTGNRQVEMSPHVKTWRGDVKEAAEKLIADTGHARIDGPVRVHMVFTTDRPKSVPKRKRLRPSTMPDLSKLCRATEDALTAAGVWKDDALVVEYSRLAKVFAGEDPEALDVPGALIRVEEITEGEDDG